MELKPFYHEAQIALSEDFTLHLVINLASTDRLERLLGKSIAEVIGEMMASVSVMTKVLWGVTREYHSDLTLDQVAGIILPGDLEKQELAEAVVATLGDLLRRAFNVTGEVEQKPRRKKAA